MRTEDVLDEEHGTTNTRGPAHETREAHRQNKETRAPKPVPPRRNYRSTRRV